MAEEENKAVVRRTWEELFNQGKLATADELIAAAFLNHAAPGSQDNWSCFIAMPFLT